MEESRNAGGGKEKEGRRVGHLPPLPHPSHSSLPHLRWGVAERAQLAAPAMLLHAAQLRCLFSCCSTHRARGLKLEEVGDRVRPITCASCSICLSFVRVLCASYLSLCRPCWSTCAIRLIQKSTVNGSVLREKGDGVNKMNEQRVATYGPFHVSGI